MPFLSPKTSHLLLRTPLKNKPLPSPSPPPKMPPRPPPLLLLLDWDGTLTLTSTIPLISSIRTFPSHPHPALPSLSSSYTSDLAAHSASYRPRPEVRRTVAEELTYLASLEEVERRSIERLENAGIWKGVRRGRIEEVAGERVREGEVVLRKGWMEMVEAVQGRGGRVGVVSVAWSRMFIAACLRESVRKEGGGGGGGAGVVGEVDVRANEIVFVDADDDDGEEGTGRLDRYFSSSDSEEEGTGIWTARGKMRVMQELIEKSRRENGGVRLWTVYVGDSATDLGCLMEADVGVCVRDEVETGEQEGLKEVLERVGVGCLHIGKWKERMERGDEGRKWLWWARDFKEVRSGILEGG